MLLRWLCADSDWDRPDFMNATQYVEVLDRSGKEPLRPISTLRALELASVALYFPRSQSRALSELLLLLDSFAHTLHCLHHLTVSQMWKVAALLHRAGESLAWELQSGVS